MRSAAPISADLPSFEAVLNGQHSSGYWASSEASILASCTEQGSVEDENVRQMIASINPTETDIETVYLTLLAIYILHTSFPDHEDEWQLIVAKAIAFLEQAGIEKPYNLVFWFTISVKQEQ